VTLARYKHSWRETGMLSCYWCRWTHTVWSVLDLYMSPSLTLGTGNISHISAAQCVLAECSAVISAWTQPTPTCIG